MLLLLMLGSFYLCLTTHSVWEQWAQCCVSENLMQKQTSGTSASLPQKAATGYNPEQPFLPVFCSEGIPGAGTEGSPSSGVFSHSYMLFWRKAGLHSAAAQQLQVLAEAFSSLNHQEIPGQRERQAVLPLQRHYCTLWITNTQLTLILLLELLLYLKGSPGLFGYMSEQ